MNSSAKSLYNYFDFKFFLKFSLTFLCLYVFWTIYIGLVTVGGSYNAFLDQFLNLPVWLRSSVLHGAKAIAALFGIHSYINGDSIRTLDDVRIVRMGWPCYGLVIKSFWVAFVFAHTDSFKRKLVWALTGVFAIWFINCWRIAILLISMEKNWNIGTMLNTNNHDLFNYFSYLIVLLLIYLYSQKSKTINPVIPSI